MPLSLAERDRVANDWATDVLAGANEVHISLHTASPGDDGQDGNEISGNGYAAVEILAFSTSSGGAGQVSNSALLTYPTPTAAWGTVTHVGLWDHPTNRLAANFLGHGTTPSLEVVTGFAPKFEIGAFKFKVI